MVDNILKMGFLLNLFFSELCSKHYDCTTCFDGPGDLAARAA